MLLVSSIRRKLVELMLLTVFIVLAWGVLFFYQTEVKELHQQVESELTTITVLKSRQIDLWRKERVGDGGVLTDNPFLIAMIDRWLTQSDETSSKHVLQRFHSIYRRYDYYDTMLVNPNGEIVLSIRGSKDKLNAYDRLNMQYAICNC